jgi:hypothetical protein
VAKQENKKTLLRKKSFVMLKVRLNAREKAIKRAGKMLNAKCFATQVAE